MTRMTGPDYFVVWDSTHTRTHMYVQFNKYAPHVSTHTDAIEGVTPTDNQQSKPQDPTP